jgi:superfamily II DNA/RNA helicase
VSSTFSDLGVPADVVTSLAQRGIAAPFPIQAMAIPPALQGKDVCGRAPTGSGKTLAFGIPLAERVARAKVARPRALVLAPTRELAAQIHEELRPLLARRGRSVASFYGGVSFTPQLKMLRRGVDVAVACPGRLADLVRRGNLILDDVDIVVIDEADRMADMGFLPEVKHILDQVRPNRQTMLFSATLDGDVDVLIKHYQRDPARFEVFADKDEIDRTTHHFVKAKREERVAVTAELVAEHGSTVVFCRTKHGADRVAGQLQKAGVSATAIHGGRSQAQRDRALASFTQGRVQALVATDVAARGIHVDNVGCVVHFDIAGDHKDYVHRSGRTGRAGAEGVVVSLVTEGDVGKVRQLQAALSLPMLPAPAKSSQPRSAGKPRPAQQGPSQGRRPQSRGQRPAQGQGQGQRQGYGQGQGQAEGQSHAPSRGRQFDRNRARGANPARRRRPAA